MRTMDTLRRHFRLFTPVPAIAALVALSGCVERRISIDTEPPGALVWLNDAQIGRTPVDVAFTHEGTYDLRIEKEGYEPLMTPAKTTGPLWDAVPIDFVVEVLPVKARSQTRWTFTLTPRDDSEEALLSRAGALRARIAEGDDTEPATQEASGSDGK